MTRSDGLSIPIDTVCIGASGGQGLRDMMALVSLLPANLPASLLFTLHRPHDRDSNLAAVLQRVSKLPVMVASDFDRLRLGVCYVGEPARHLSLQAGGRVRLIDDNDAHYRNASIDLLFGSVAEHAGARAIGVVLSGALADGSSGLAAIKRAGGVCMAVDWGGLPVSEMPNNAIKAVGPLDCVGAVAVLAAEIARLIPAPTLLDR